jgi:hypothetical protein
LLTRFQFRFASAFVLAIGVFLPQGLLVGAYRFTFDGHTPASGQ